MLRSLRSSHHAGAYGCSTPCACKEEHAGMMRMRAFGRRLLMGSVNKALRAWMEAAEGTARQRHVMRKAAGDTMLLNA